MSSVPKSVVFLTCDLYGVLPPVSVLSREQALFWFLNGYTALVGSTEVGSSREINPTFSACFGAAFFPRSPVVYGELLLQKLASSNASVYLVNTGWHSGSFSCDGRRFDLSITRKIIDHIHSGAVLSADKERDSVFDLEIPIALEGIDAKLLNPARAWSDTDSYARHAEKLRASCQKNFAQYEVGELHIPG